MFFINDEERDDQDLDEEEDDADIDNSDDEEEDDDADDESDDDDSDDEVDEDGDDEDDESGKKKSKKSDDRDPKSKKNRDNARRRKSSKDGTYKEQQETAKRLERLEKSEKQRNLLERKRTFGYENALSPKQVDYVFRNTKRPTPKFLNRPEIRAGLDAIKRSENVSQNTPSNNGQVFKDKKGKEVKYTDLSPEERQSRFTDRRKAILESKRG